MNTSVTNICSCMILLGWVDMLYSIISLWFNGYLFYAETGNWYISLASEIRLMFHKDRQLW